MDKNIQEHSTAIEEENGFNNSHSKSSFGRSKSRIVYERVRWLQTWCMLRCWCWLLFACFMPFIFLDLGFIFYRDSWLNVWRILLVAWSREFLIILQSVYWKPLDWERILLQLPVKHR